MSFIVTESTGRKLAIQAAGGSPAPAVTANMLIDTGASHTALDDTIIKSLNLQPTGSMGVLTPSTGATPHQVLTYDVDLLLLGFNGAPHLIVNQAVSACNVLAQGISGLIGRDILSKAQLTYSGIGRHFYLSF